MKVCNSKQICSKEEGFGELDFLIYPFHVSVISSASFTLLAGIHFLLKILSSKNKYNTMCESINFVSWSILKWSHIFGLIAGLVNFLQLFGNKRFVFFLPLTNHLRNVWHKVSVKKNLNNSIELLRVVNKITQGHTKQILNLSSWCQRPDHSLCLFVCLIFLTAKHAYRKVHKIFSSVILLQCEYQCNRHPGQETEYCWYSRKLFSCPS